MSLYKQDTFRISPILSRRTRGTRIVTGIGLAACFSLPLCVRAQDTDTTGRAGEKPDPTSKKTSVPQGVKPKPDAKKPATTSKNKMSDKNMNMTRRIALVFPVDAKGAAAEQISDVITDVEKSRLSATGRYGAVSFLTSLPSIRRAVGEQSLSTADVTPPFATRSKAQKLTTTAGYDLAVINSLDQYEYNADTQNVTMVLSIQLFDFSKSQPQSLGAAAESVTTAAKSAKNATDTTAAEAAARNLTEKLMTNVLNSAMAAKTSDAAPAGGTGAAKPTSK